MVGQPADVAFSDDAGVQGLEEELTNGHESDVTTSLHHAKAEA